MEDRRQKLQKAIKESVERVEELGLTVLFASNYGSHNYNLDICNNEYQSDIDTKVIVIPSLEDLINNSQPVSHTIEISTGQADIKDIRMFVNTLLKANIQFLEVLQADEVYINPYFQEDFQWFIDNIDILIKECRPQLLKSMYGMSLEKKKALCHPYPTIKWKIDKWGYDGKQLHHIMRLRDFISKYFYNDIPFKEAIKYHKGPARDALIAAKLNRFDLDNAVQYAELQCNKIKEEVDNLLPLYSADRILSEEYLRRSREIIIKNIKKKILEEGY